MQVRDQLIFQNTAVCRVGKIRLAGYLRNDTGEPAHALRILGSYAMSYLIEGDGVLELGDGSERPLTAGHLILLLPDLPHRYGPRAGQHWREFYVVFDGPVFDLWREERVIGPRHEVFYLKPIRYWLGRLEAAVREPGTTGPASPLRQASLLQTLLADILARGHERSDDEQDWLRRAMNLIDRTPPTQRPDWLELAGAAGCGYEAFRKRFTALAGMPPARFRTQRLIERACALLSEGLSVRAVAERMGFANEFHFSRRFRQVTGLPPSEYRRMHLTQRPTAS